MPDISMCRNFKCPSKLNCYRFCAIPNDIWQSMFAPEIERNNNKCNYFIDKSNYTNKCLPEAELIELINDNIADI